MNKDIEFGNEQIANARIKFTQSGVIEGEDLAMQIGFELAEGKTISTNKFSFDGEKMKNILNILEIRSWEELPRKYARVAILNDKVVRIGNIINDKWIKI